MVERSWDLPSWMTRRLALLSAAVFLVACSDSGCNCEGFENAKFPEQHYDKTLESGAQVRVTQSGLDFVESQVPTLIREVQPDGLSFCVPRDSSSNPAMCLDHTCTDGSPGCQIDLAIENTEITPVPSDTLEIALTIGDVGGQDANGNYYDELDLEYDASFLGTADCVVRLSDANGTEADPGALEATLPVTVSVDQNSPTREVRIELGEVSLGDIRDQIRVDIDGDWRCDTADALKSLFWGTLEGQITGMLEETIAGIEAEQLCRPCGDGQPVCPGNSTCGDNAGTQSCMYDDGTCVPADLGVEGNLLLGQLIGDYSQNPDAKVHVLAKAADLAEVDTGLSLGMRIGAQPESFGRCIPVDPTQRPSLQPIDPSPSILSDSRPGGDPFMVGIGVHKRSLEQVLWSTWGGGVLCVSVGGNDVSQLSVNSLGLFLPSIKELANRNAMLYLQIAPQTAPSIKLGANTVTPDGDTYSIDDPLMTIDWKDLDLHFYVYAHERFVRAFTLRADLLLPLALAADGQGSIIPVLGDMEGAIKNIRPLRTELLEEDTDALIELVPTLVSLALPSVADSISQPIELPEFMGLRIALEQDDITSVDANSMIALFADLVPATQAYSMELDTMILNAELDTSHWSEAGVPRPVVTLDVTADLPAYANQAMSSDVEYAYRVDGGIWSLYHRTERLEIRDPMLVLEGKHRIEVRARFRGEPETTQRQPTETTITVDYSAPEFTIERDGKHIALDAFDTVDETNDLLYRYRVVDGIEESQWTAWTAESTIDLKEIGAPEHFRLVAQVKDRAGHVAEDDQNIVWQPSSFEGGAPTLDQPGAEPKAGCQAAGNSSPVGAAGGLLALFAAAMLLWRRRNNRPSLRRTSLLLIALVGFGLSACSEDGTGTNKSNVCEPSCAVNQECVKGTCEPIDGACETGGDCTCPEGEIGVCGDDGMCACEVACADGCGDDQFCCHTSNSCQDMPDPCADQVCDPGFEPSVSSQGSADSATCEVSGAACECVEMPPLPLGVHGPYASVAEQGNVRAVSVYNKTYTDLMVATVDQSGEPTWYFVDGLPEDGDIEGSLGGPRGGISDRGANVGTHTAIAVDEQKNLHVFYRDEDNDALKYARGTAAGDSYSFETSTIDEEGDTGYFTSAVVKDGAVHAVYAVSEVERAEEGWKTQLRYVSFPADAAIDQLALEPSIVHETAAANPCGDSCQGDELCFTGAQAACEEASDDCGAACGDGLECRAGSCQPYYVTGKTGYPLMTGVFAQLSQTADGIAVTFYDHLQQQAGWATRTGDAWSQAEFLGAQSGPYVSGAFDQDGQLHLAYMDTVNHELVYEIVGQGVRETIVSGVRDTAEGYVLSDIGEDVDLRLTGDGSVQVLYQDATWHKLHVASRDASGSWMVDTLTEPGDPYSGSHGFFAAMVRNPASSALAVDFVINKQATPADSKPEFHTLP